MFNDGRYHERSLDGALSLEVLADGHPAAPLAPEPICTRSQYVAYIDPQTGQKVAEAHLYRRVDGTIGASGRPDPQRIWTETALYMVVKT